MTNKLRKIAAGFLLQCGVEKPLECLLHFTFAAPHGGKRTRQDVLIMGLVKNVKCIECTSVTA